MNEKGLIHQEKFKPEAPRKETSEATQRPKSQTKKVKGDDGRGSFTDKC